MDDNPLIRKMVCAAFVSSGFDSCVHAENGAHALVEAERVKPSVIILDLSMPVMNGLEAAPQLHRILPETPIVLYTLYEPAKLAKTDISSMGISLVASKDEPLQSLVSKVESLVYGK
ncbi:MAG: response regulator transcription factor [Candidatus Acidiferrales bacterium]